MFATNRPRKLELLLLSMGLGPAMADFVSPNYAAPLDLTSKKSAVYEGWKNATSHIETMLRYHSGDNGTEPIDPEADLLIHLKDITFSIGMFSLHDSHAAEKLQFHYTGKEVADGLGTDDVNGDSIWRIQSISKLISVYTALQYLEPNDWELPLTSIMPELFDDVDTVEDVPVNYPNWDQITPFSLASHISGLSNIILPTFTGDTYANILELGQPEEMALAFGLPPPDPEDPSWVSVQDCPFPGDCMLEPDAWFRSIAAQPEQYPSWTSPLYSNAAFILFGMVVPRLTNKTWDEMYMDRVFEPLGLKDTSSLGFDENYFHRSVIVGDAVLMMGESIETTKPSGGLHSSLNDLAKLGLSILNSTQLSPDVTRKWMKPVSHTAQLDIAFGTPWEIFRWQHPVSGVVHDMYTKSGDGFNVSTTIMLLPDFDAGFTILTAGSMPELTVIIAHLANFFIETMLPALEEESVVEAEARFGGTYVSNVDGLNTTLTLAVNTTAGAPQGLMITEFISNSTDVLLTSETLGISLPRRLVPTGVDGKRVSMRALRQTDWPHTKREYALKFQSSDAVSPSAGYHGGLPTNLFVFNVGDDGQAKSVSPVAYRVNLDRQD